MASKRTNEITKPELRNSSLKFRRVGFHEIGFNTNFEEAISGLAF